MNIVKSNNNIHKNINTINIYNNNNINILILII